MTRARELADLGGSADAGGITGKNLIINGNLTCSQRGTSFAATSSQLLTLDRWYCSAGASGNLAVTQQSFTVGQTDVPNEPKNYVRLTCTNTPSDPVFGQKIEDVRNGAGQTVTLSFWAKADSAKTFTEGGYFQQIFDSVSSNVTINIGSWSVTTSWQKITITTSLPSINGKTLGFNSYLDFRLDTNNNENVVLDIANVQLELGSSATPFEHESYAETLRKCHRFYIQGTTGCSSFYPVGLGTASSTTSFRGMIPTSVEMRTVNTFGNLTGARGNGTAKTLSSHNLQEVTALGVGFNAISSGLTASKAYVVTNSATNGIEFYLDGEL